jgi:hypothetical protein
VWDKGQSELQKEQGGERRRGSLGNMNSTMVRAL